MTDSLVVDVLPRSVRLRALRRLLDAHPARQPVKLSEVHAAVGTARGPRLTRIVHVVDELGQLVDDTPPTMRPGPRPTARGSLPGTATRSEHGCWCCSTVTSALGPGTLDGYLGRVRPHLLARSATRRHLREITEDDVRAALARLRGHPLAGTFVALRSLLGFAKRRRLIFADPTRRLRFRAGLRRPERCCR